MGNKAKRKLKRACEGSGWITVMPRSQDDTDIPRDEFRDALRLQLDPPLQNPPLKCNCYSDLFALDHECGCKRGGIVGIRHNIMNKEWEEMCGAEFTPDAVNDSGCNLTHPSRTPP